MSNLLYNKNTVISRLFYYFSAYFENVSVPTAESLFLFLVSILALELAIFIWFLYQHFLSKITEISLNAFYYAYSYAKIDYSTFMNITVKIALNIIPKSVAYHPVFLCLDDTIVPKSGKKFEQVSKLYDHATHHDSCYLNGHCFVAGWQLCYHSARRNSSPYALYASLEKQKNFLSFYPSRISDVEQIKVQTMFNS